MKRKKRIGTVCKIVGCIFLLFLALFPIYWLVALAIRPTSEMTGHISILPHMLTFDHFKHLFTDRNFGTAITNSLKPRSVRLFFRLRSASVRHMFSQDGVSASA